MIKIYVKSIKSLKLTQSDAIRQTAETITKKVDLTMEAPDTPWVSSEHFRL